MSEKAKYKKSDFIKLLLADSDSVSSDKDSARSFLSSEGINVDAMVDDGLKRIKQMKLEIAAERTKKEMHIVDSLTSQSVSLAEALLNDPGFSFAGYAKKEKMALNFRNFESLSPDDIKEILIKHFTLKLLNEANEKK